MTIDEFSEARNVPAKTVYSRIASLKKQGKIPVIWRDTEGDMIDSVFSLLDALYPVRDGERVTKEEKIARQCAELNTRIAELTRENEILAHGLRTAKAERDQARAEVVASKAEYEKLRVETSVEAAKIAGEVDKLKGQIDGLEQANQAQAAQIASQQDTIEELKAARRDTQRSLDVLTARLPAPKTGFFARIFGKGEKKDA